MNKAKKKGSVATASSGLDYKDATKNKEIYASLVEWLYLNDGEFKDKYEWREALISKLKQLLDLKEDEPHAVIFNDPF